MIGHFPEIEQIDIREFTNAVALVLDLALALIMMVFLASRLNMKNWYQDLANQAAIALSVLLLGKFIIRAWGVVLLYQMSHGGDGWAVEQRVPLLIVGTALVMLGALCAVRVFTPDRWFGRYRNVAWVSVGLLSVLVGWFVVWL